MEKQDKFLSVKDLEVVYTSEKKIVKAVNKVSFDMEKGETLALVGETGAGKTTIAKAILRILPDPPAILKGGEIHFEGTDLLKLEEKEMRKVRGDKIAMIFQDPMTALNPIKRIGNQIAESLVLHQNLSQAEANKRAQELLEMVGIPGSRSIEYPLQFSGGMKQRVVIAMALACEPDLLLADEPTTALDVTIQAQVLELINDLRKQKQTSMILITHDLGVVAQMSDKVAVVYAGRIVEMGTKRQVFKNPQHPYTLGLFNSLPSMNDDAERLHPINGAMPDPTALPEGCAFAARCKYATDACRAGELQNVEVEPGHTVLCRNLNKEG